jgi:antitoxin HigA-1
MKKNGMRPVPPGEILNEEFLKPLGLTANALAKAIGVPPNRITAILKDERGITGDTAIRLGTFFKTSAEFWMKLQMTYELRNAEKALPGEGEKEYRKQQDHAGMIRKSDDGDFVYLVNSVPQEPHFAATGKRKRSQMSHGSPSTSAVLDRSWPLRAGKSLLTSQTASPTSTPPSACSQDRSVCKTQSEDTAANSGARNR